MIDLDGSGCMSSVVVTCRGSTCSARVPLAASRVSLIMEGVEAWLDMAWSEVEAVVEERADCAVYDRVVMLSHR